MEDVWKSISLFLAGLFIPTITFFLSFKNKKPLKRKEILEMTQNEIQLIMGKRFNELEMEIFSIKTLFKSDLKHLNEQVKTLQVEVLDLIKLMKGMGK